MKISQPSFFNQNAHQYGDEDDEMEGNDYNADKNSDKDQREKKRQKTSRWVQRF